MVRDVELLCRLVGDKTAVARIIHMVEEASQRRAPIQNFADKFSQQLVPLSFVMAMAVWTITQDVNRALNMLIIDYSCGVRLSTVTEGRPKVVEILLTGDVEAMAMVGRESTTLPLWLRPISASLWVSAAPPWLSRPPTLPLPATTL